MDLKDILDARERLEADLRSLIVRFSEDTGVMPSEVHIERLAFSRLVSSRPEYKIGAVRVDKQMQSDHNAACIVPKPQPI